MAKNSDNAIPERYEKCYKKNKNDKTERERDLHVVDTSFLEYLITDLGYELSDKYVYFAMVKAKLLLDHSATALEPMKLVKLILQYDINVRENVSYVFDVLCRRAVFEYTKKRINYHMLGHSKNIINRLRFLNDINLIPKRLLTSKNSGKQVEPIVLEFLVDDAKYGHLTAGENTIPVDGMYPREAETKIREFTEAMVTVGDFDASSTTFDDDNSKKQHIYEMPEKRLLEIHVDTQVGVLMAYVHKQLASSLSRRSKLNNSTSDVALTRDTYNVLARKITKMVFCMGGPYKEKPNVLEVVIKKIATEIIERSSKVLYKDKTRHNAGFEDTKADIHMSKLVDMFIASTKSIK